MNKNRLIKAFIITLSSSIVGLLFLTFVFLLPTNNIDINVSKSVDTLYDEGMYPHLFNWCTSRLDNSTDSIMLLEAANDINEPLIKKVLLVYRGSINGDAQYYSIIDRFINNISYDGNTSYARYWHGYLVLLKPLLSFFSYNEIRIINGIIQLILNLIICVLLYKLGKTNYIISYVLSMIVIMPVCLAYSLQFSSCFYISTCFSIFVLLNANKKKDSYYILFLLTGISLAYFDFLTYPIATLGMPLLMYIITTNANNKEVLNNILLFSFYWIFGYSVMWLMKWVYASIFTEQNVIMDAINSILLRSFNINNSGQKINIFMTLYKNIKQFIYTPFTIVVLMYIAYMLVKINKKKPSIYMSSIVPFIIIILMPFIWYLLICNHSFIHSYFTNKALVVSLLSMLFALNYILEINEDV